MFNYSLLREAETLESNAGFLCHYTKQLEDPGSFPVMASVGHPLLLTCCPRSAGESMPQMVFSHTSPPGKMALFNSTFMVSQIIHYNPVHPVTCKQNPMTRESVSSRKSGPDVKTRVME